jgi:hypothetical protein
MGSPKLCLNSIFLSKFIYTSPTFPIHDKIFHPSKLSKLTTCTRDYTSKEIRVMAGKRSVFKKLIGESNKLT